MCIYYLYDSIDFIAFLDIHVKFVVLKFSPKRVGLLESPRRPFVLLQLIHGH